MAGASNAVAETRIQLMQRKIKSLGKFDKVSDENNSLHHTLFSDFFEKSFSVTLTHLPDEKKIDFGQFLMGGHSDSDGEAPIEKFDAEHQQPYLNCL